MLEHENVRKVVEGGNGISLIRGGDNRSMPTMRGTTMRRGLALFFALALGVALALGSAPAFAETRKFPPVSLYDSEVRSLTSTFSDQEYSLLVSFPKDYATSDKTYPVLYLLDADTFIGMATTVSRLLPLEGFFLNRQIVPELLIVGIGYPGGFKEMAIKRDRDLTPQSDPAIDGTEPFFRFLKEQLIPFVESTYKTDPSDRVLFGSSAAGLFVLNTLLRHPGTFHRYIASSPRMGQGMFRLEDDYAREHDDLSGTVFLSAGSAGRIEQSIAAGVERFFASLSGRKYPSLKLLHDSLTGESHVSAQSTAFTRGLKAIYFEPSGAGPVAETD